MRLQPRLRRLLTLPGLPSTYLGEAESYDEDATFDNMMASTQQYKNFELPRLSGIIEVDLAQVLFSNSIMSSQALGERETPISIAINERRLGVEYLLHRCISIMVPTPAKKVRLLKNNSQHHENEAESSRRPRGRPDWTKLEDFVKKVEPELHYSSAAKLHTILGDAYRMCFDILGNMDDREEAARHRSLAAELTPEGDLNKVITHGNLGNSFQDDFEKFGKVDDVHRAIQHHSTVVKLTTYGDPNKVIAHSSLGVSLLARFKRLGNMDDLFQAIDHNARAVRLTPDGHPEKPAVLNNLGNCFEYRFSRVGEMDDLVQAINHLTRAVELTPDRHPQRAVILGNLGSSFQKRFERLGEMDDLVQAIDHKTRAVELTPDGHPNKPSWLDNLGSSFQARFKRLGETDDLIRAIDHETHAVELTPDDHPKKPSRLNNRGNSFLTRFKRLGETDDLIQAIDHLTHAVELTPDGHPDKPSRLNNLGASFQARFERLGKMDDLIRAIDHFTRAVELTPDGHPDKPGRINNLGNSFQARFKRLGDTDNLIRAIENFTRAVKLTPDGHPDKPSWLNNLGGSFQAQFERLGEMDDLIRAIDHFTRAVELTPDGHPDRPGWINNLGNSLQARFERLGDTDDLIRAISHLTRAVELMPDDHTNKPVLLTNLGNAFEARFERLGEMDDLVRAIDHLTYAVELTPDDHPDKPSRLNNLGGSFQTQFKRLGETDDLVRAIDHLTLAVELTPDGHPNKPGWINNLGSSFQARFKRLQETDDLIRAIDLFTRAVELTPDGHPDKPSVLINLGNSFQARFERFGDVNDLNQSLHYGSCSLDLSPDDQPSSPQYSLHLSQLLSQRSYPGDLNAAIFLCITAAYHSSAAPSVRFRASKKWASYLNRLHDTLTPFAYQAYEVAIRQLPRISWTGISVNTRFQKLEQTTSIGSDAAAAALCANQLKVSVEWLEQSRSVVWAQIIQMRTPITNLTNRFPQLGNHLLHIWKKLDTEDVSVTSEERINLAVEFDRLLDEIRTKPGFWRFLLPTEFAKLQTAAGSGSIVILNASQYRCDAFVLLPSQSSPQVIPLEGCTLLRVRDMQYLFRQAASGSTFRPDRVERAFGPGPSVPTQNEMFRMILNVLWSDVVRPCLDVLRHLTVGHLLSMLHYTNAVFPQAPDETGLMHVRWCPTGPFSFLPIHAATEFGEQNEVLSRLSDTVVSSYIPTVSTLLDPKRRSSSAVYCNVLAVLQPATPGQCTLSGVNKESDIIYHRASETKIHFDSLRGENATVDEVLQAIPEYSVVHFACHGVQDLQFPLNSGLILHDGRLTLSKIMHTKLPNAQLAFLSACETATGEESYPDEAVHVAAGMLAAGFRDVIGTMWTIQDSAAPAISDIVYSKVFQDGKLLVDRIPFALHRAVERLRNRKPDNFMAWMPFIHMGP